MDLLEDIWTPAVELVVCGTAVGSCAALRGHHYAQRGNAFWQLLYAGGLTPTLLAAQDESLLPQYGIGLVDLVKDPSRPHGFDVRQLQSTLDRARPRWVAFNGRVGAQAVAAAVGAPRPGLGPQEWSFAGAQVFVLPSSSGANQRRDHGGRPRRVDWWAELADVLESDPRRPSGPSAEALRTRAGRSAPRT